MKQTAKRLLCILTALLLLWACVPTALAAADYQISSTTLAGGTTLYVFQPPVGAYRVEVANAAATLTRWNGSKFFVAGVAETAVDGVLTWECTSEGQTLLIGLADVTSATITITRQAGYVPPAEIVFEPYVNVHTPVDDFAMPTEELTRVDIMRPQTLVADADGIYHLNSVDGPVLYVNMCAATYADLYACYHPTGGIGALYLHGRYEDANGQMRGYEFLEAMRPYAEALDGDGYYYLTVDLAVYLQTYGANQGWFTRESSPFTLIKQGKFIAESAWLVNAYYVEPAVVGGNGDMDGDGKVNNRDLGLLQRYLNGWGARIFPAACDMDGNGAVNNRDLGLLQQLLNS